MECGGSWRATMTTALLGLLTLALVSATATAATTTEIATIDECPSGCTCSIMMRKNVTLCLEAGLNAIPSGLANRTNILEVSGNRIDVLRDNQFRSLGLLSLEAISLCGNGVKEVQPKTFAGLKWLKELDLSNNSIVSLDRYVFADNKLLEMVNLSGNRISTLASFQFTALPALKELDLSSCAIRDVQPEALANLLFLESLSLRGNSLGTLPSDSFTWLKELNEVDLRDNPWRCDCNVQSLFVLLSIRRLYTGDLRCYNVADNTTTLWQHMDAVDRSCIPNIENSVKENILNLSKRLYAQQQQQQQKQTRRFGVTDAGKKLFSGRSVETSLLPIALIAIAVTISIICLISCYAKCHSTGSTMRAVVAGVCCGCFSCHRCVPCLRSNKKHDAGAGVVADDDDDDDDEYAYDFEKSCYSNFDQDGSDISLTLEL